MDRAPDGCAALAASPISPCFAPDRGGRSRDEDERSASADRICASASVEVCDLDLERDKVLEKPSEIGGERHGEEGGRGICDEGLEGCCEDDFCGGPMQPHGSQRVAFQTPLTIECNALAQQHLRYLHRQQAAQRLARAVGPPATSPSSSQLPPSSPESPMLVPMGPLAQQLQQLQLQQQSPQLPMPPQRESSSSSTTWKRVFQSGHGPPRDYSSEGLGNGPEIRANYCSSEDGSGGGGSGLRWNSRSGSKHSLGRNPSRTWGGSAGSDLMAWSVAALVGTSANTSHDGPGIGRLARQATEEWTSGRHDHHPHFQSQRSSSSHTIVGQGQADTSSHANTNSHTSSGPANYTSAAISNVAETEGGSAGNRSTYTSVNGIPIARRSVSGQTTTSAVKSRQLLGDIVRRKSRTSTGSESTFEQLSERVQTLVSFSGCEDLLRGCNLHSVLRLGGRMLDPNVEHDIDPYELSYNTDAIDHFISHNWAVGRWRKYLCLITYFNFWPAVYVTSLYCAMMIGLVLTDIFPRRAPGEQGWDGYPRTFICSITAVPVFFLALFFLRELPFKGPTVFLDRACIHQEDSEIQKRSIEKLGAFLCHSDMMIICYTDIYLTRLWTVYEVASFLALYPIRRMRVIPTILPIVLLAGTGLTYILGVFSLVLNELVKWYYMEQSWMPVAWFCFGVVCRSWARSKRKIGERLSTFSVHNCNCFDPRDRPLVYANIATLMKETQGIPDEATEEEALDCFDALVREELPQALTLSLGPTCMSYSQTVVAAVFNYVPRVIDVMIGLESGMPLKTWCCSYLLWYATLVWCVTPLCIASQDLISSKLLHLSGWREVLFLMAGSLATSCFAALSLNTLDVLSNLAVEEEVGSFWMYVELVLCLVGCVVARMTFNTFCCNRNGSWHVPAAPSIIRGRGSGQGSAASLGTDPPPNQVSPQSRDSNSPYFGHRNNATSSRRPQLGRAATIDTIGAPTISRFEPSPLERASCSSSPISTTRQPNFPSLSDRQEAGSKETTSSVGPILTEGMGQTRSLPELSSSAREEMFPSFTSSSVERSSFPPLGTTKKPGVESL